MKYYIGLDAHSTTSTAVVVKENGEIALRETFPTTEGNLVGFMRKIPGEKHLTFEECHLAQWLYVTLKEEADRLLVCNPVYVAKKQGPKTDFRDALHLAQELRGNHLQGVYHDDSKWIELRVLVNSYLDLVEQIVASKNRLKAVFRSSGLSTNESNFYADKDRAKELPSECAKFVGRSLFSQIESMEALKLEFKSYFHQNRLRYRPIRNLCTIPGIDLVRANIILAVVCMPHRFKNKHMFYGYCMLARHIQMSGGRIYGNKRVHGRRELRDIYIGAAESCLRTETSLRKYYDDLRAKGVAHKEARLSVARRIAALSLSLLKNNETYNDDYQAEQQERVAIRKTLNLDTI